MAKPTSFDPKHFERCAILRLEEASVLYRADYTTGAVYLAGYGIECVLKSLILSSVPQSNRAVMMNSFRRSEGHDYEWLRRIYLSNGGPAFPRPTTKDFASVNEWSTQLRYRSDFIRPKEARAFLEAADRIIEWAKGRL